MHVVVVVIVVVDIVVVVVVVDVVISYSVVVFDIANECTCVRVRFVRLDQRL